MLLAFVGFLLSANLVSAALVPCGNDASNLCTTCDFFKLADNVKNFLMFKVVPPVGVLFVLIAGFFMLIGGAKPGNYERGKKILTDLVWGLLIIFGAWMLTNTALKLLAGKSDISSNWYKIECTATSGGGGGITPGGTAFLCKAEPSTLSATKKTVNLTITGGSGQLNCTWPDLSYGTYTSKSGCSATVSFPDEKKGVTINVPTTDSSDPPKTGTASCKVNSPTQVPPANGDLCTGAPKPGNNPCGSPTSCSQYSSAINQYASGIATADVIKSIIANESSCNANAGSGAGACGLTQFLPSTARIYARNCGVDPGVVTCSWLKANPTKAICLTAAYLNSLAAGRCAGNIRHTIAAYNGGGKACRNSTSCAGAGCDGSARREWECTAVANRYGETRTYVKRNLYCIQHPGF